MGRSNRRAQVYAQRKAKRQVKRRVTGEFRRRRITGRSVEVESIVVSARGRKLLPSGQVDPLAPAPAGQPQGKQDFFLQSRAIGNMSWDRRSEVLEIQFVGGGVWQYWKVPQTVWIAFKNSGSKGRFFHHRIYGSWSGPKGSMKYTPKYNERRII